MAKVLALKAQPRTRAGKGASRALRREGQVPAVLYGEGTAAEPIRVEEKQLMKLLGSGFFLNSTVEIELAGKRVHTLPRDVQFHPVTDRPIHVDFLRIAANAIVIVNIPVHFVNETDSPGLKRGGVLNVVRHEIEVHVPANAIPDHIVVDVSGYDVGDTIHISKVALPDGVKPVIDRDFTIATIAAPSSLKSDEDADAAVAAAAAAASAEQATAADSGAAPGGE